VRYLVLDAIAETPRHGYEIMQAIDEKSRGAYKPSPGVTYPTLQLLEDVGHVRVSERDGKKVYAITAAGTRELEEHKDEVASFYDRAADLRGDDRGGEMDELMLRVRRLVRAFHRAARRGRLTAAQAADLRKTLDEAIAKLEALVG
jgi:DNA-binding PadR family transcriptional regulator